MPLSSDLHALRDPAAPRRLGALVLAAVVLWPLFQGAGFSLGALFDPGNLQVIGRFLATFLQPETGRDFLGYLGRATLETLAIATAGMALAFVLAVPLASWSRAPRASGGRSIPSRAACSPSCAACPSWSGPWSSCASSAWGRPLACWPWA